MESFAKRAAPAVDIPTLFNQTIPAAFVLNPARAVSAVRHRFQFNITGVGAWSVDATKPSCVAGTISGDDVTTLTMTADEFQDLCVMPRKKVTTLVPQVWSGRRNSVRRYMIANLLGMGGVN